MNYYHIIQMLATAVYTLFLPGLLVSFILFRPNTIDWIERIALSFSLSLAIVPLVAFYTNLLGLKVTMNNIVMEILVICMITGVILPFRYLSRSQNFEKISLTKQRTITDTIIKTTDKQLILNSHTVFRELFQISLVTYLILLLAETIKNGFVTFFFNLNILLGVVLISGIVMILTHYQPTTIPTIWGWKQIISAVENRTKVTQKQPISKRDWYFILSVSLGGGLLVNYETQELLGGLSLILTLVTMIIIGLLSYLIFIEE